MMICRCLFSCFFNISIRSNESQEDSNAAKIAKDTLNTTDNTQNNCSSFFKRLFCWCKKSKNTNDSLVTNTYLVDNSLTNPLSQFPPNVTASAAQNPPQAPRTKHNIMEHEYTGWEKEMMERYEKDFLPKLEEKYGNDFISNLNSLSEIIGIFGVKNLAKYLIANYQFQYYQHSMKKKERVPDERHLKLYHLCNEYTFIWYLLTHIEKTDSKLSMLSIPATNPIHSELSGIKNFFCEKRNSLMQEISTYKDHQFKEYNDIVLLNKIFTETDLIE